MTTEKIRAGDVYKNYSTLCEALGIAPKTNNSKKKQLKEIEEVLHYKRDGHMNISECRKALNQTLIDYLMKSIPDEDKGYTSMIIDEFIRLTS